MNWSPDRDLRRRMALTLAALAVLTLAFGVGLSLLVAWGTGCSTVWSVSRSRRRSSSDWVR